MSADHVDTREAQIIQIGLDILSKEPAFRDIVRLFQSRIAQKQALEPLQKAFINEVWRFVARDAGV